MTGVPQEKDSRVLGAPESARGNRSLWLTAAALAVVVALVGAWIWWSRTQGSVDPEQRKRLLAAVERGRQLTAELGAIKPPNQPDCPPGQSVKSFPPDAVLPAAPSASNAVAGAASGAASSPLDGAFAKVLPDYALAQRLEQATAMVIAFDPNSKSGNGSSGSGFFISPNFLVTNRHVVEGDNMTLLLTSKALGKVRRAKLMKITSEKEIGAPDFALLRMDDGTAPGIVPIATEVGKLAAVVSAGYPGVVMESDPNYERLIKGDPNAAPDMSLTQGAVQSLQARPGGLQVVLHTAGIAHGNSGGPLVDACGRVVGINTFVRVEEKESAKLNFAIASSGVSAFLQGAGVTVNPDARPCGARQ